MAPRFGVLPTITEAAVSEANVELAAGNRCISVGHKTRVTNATLLALSRAGVAYISTRSIGYNHIDVDYAESVGISVGNVAYSPDSVADYTLMLMLMAVRNAKSIIRRADVHDYRLNDVRGKELRDLTVGVVGNGAHRRGGHGPAAGLRLPSSWPTTAAPGPPPTTFPSTNCCGAATSSRSTRRSTRTRTISSTAAASSR